MGWTGENKEIPTQKMILYTEKQLIDAYTEFTADLKKTTIPIPTLEDFRKIYEDYYENYYRSGNDEKRNIN